MLYPKVFRDNRNYPYGFTVRLHSKPYQENAFLVSAAEVPSAGQQIKERKYNKKHFTFCEKICRPSSKSCRNGKTK